MRWYVDINSIGSNNPTHRYCVEAEQWQKALQGVRARRGDDAPFGNFSIELLEEGFRAIDPLTRTRYVVHRAPDEAALNDQPEVLETEARMGGSGAKPPDAKASRPRPSARGARTTKEPAVRGRSPAIPDDPVPRARPAPVAAPPPPPPPSEPTNPATPMSKVSATPIKVPDAPPSKSEPASKPPASSVRPSNGAPAAAPMSQPPLVVPRPMQAETAFERMTGGVAVTMPLSISPTADVPTDVLPPFKVLSRRSEDPTPASPLTYREMAIVVADTTSLRDAEAIVRSQFEVMRNALSGAPKGKFLQLAVFDHEFAAKPKRLPVVTLSFKDWRDQEPEVRFPMRDGLPPRSPSTAPPPQPSVPPKAESAAPPPPAPPSAAPSPPSVAPEPPVSTPVSASPSTMPEAVRLTPVVSITQDFVIPPSAPTPTKRVPVVEPEVEAPPVVVSEPAPPPPPRPSTPASAPSKPTSVPAAAPSVPSAPPTPSVPSAPPAPSVPSAPPAPSVPSAPPAPPSKSSIPKPAPSAQELDDHDLVDEPSGSTPGVMEKKAIPGPSPSEIRRSAADMVGDDERTIVKPSSPPPPNDDLDFDVHAPASPSPSPSPSPLLSSPPVPVPVPVPDSPSLLALPPIPTGPPPRPASIPPPNNLPPISVQAPSVPAPSVQPGGPPVGILHKQPKSSRKDGDDLLTDLFEATSDLNFLRDPMEGAEFVLDLVYDSIPCLIAMVSLFDINTREFVVVRQAILATEADILPKVVLARASEFTEIIAATMRARRTNVVLPPQTQAVTKDPRWLALNVIPTSMVVAPVIAGGRFLGLIEAANPLDGAPFTEGDGHALTYIGEQFAEFLAQRELVLSPEHILKPKLAALARR